MKNLRMTEIKNQTTVNHTSAPDFKNVSVRGQMLPLSGIGIGEVKYHHDVTPSEKLKLN